MEWQTFCFQLGNEAQNFLKASTQISGKARSNEYMAFKRPPYDCVHLKINAILISLVEIL